MLQFFEWFWRAVGVADAYGLTAEQSFQGFISYTASPFLFFGGILLLAVFVFSFTIMVICTLLSVNKFLKMTAGELYKI